MLRSGRVPAPLRRALRGLLPVVLIVLGASVALVWLSAQMHLRDVTEGERTLLTRVGRLFKDTTEDAYSDFVVYAGAEELPEVLGGDGVALARLRQEWSEILRVKRRYDQLRLLDASGREVLRAERTAEGSVRFAAEAELQDKSARPYFKDAMRARRGGITVSALDLNVEHGEVERPFKPTLRFSKTLRDDAGRTLGVVVLNVLASSMLDRARAALRSSHGSYGMLNGAGYTLLSPEPGLEWAFMQAGGENRTLARTDPELWRHLAGDGAQTGILHGALVARLKLCSGASGCAANASDSTLHLAYDAPDLPWIVFTRVNRAQLLAGGLLDWSVAPLLIAFAVILLIGALAAQAAWRLGRTVDELTVNKDELERRGALIDSFVGNNPVFMFATDREGRFLFANKAYERFALGGKSGSILGKRHADLFQEEYAGQVRGDEDEVLATGDPREVERAVGEGEARLTYQALKFPIRAADGHLQAVGTIARDVSDRVRADQARAESERRFRAILQAAPDAVVISDANGRIVMVNPAAERMFGYPASALEGSPAVSLASLGERASLSQLLEAARERTAEAPNAAHASEGLRKGGSAFPVEVTCSGVDTSVGRWVISIARDVSERRSLEQQLTQSQKLESIGQLTGGVAHDFNNLLGIIMGNLDLLERAVAGDAAASKRVQTALHAAQRGAELTRRLLAFSRRQQLAPEPVQANDAISGILEMGARTLGPEIRLETSLAPDLPPVLVDANGLESAILNLAINARDAMPAGGVLRISTSLARIDARDSAVRAGELAPGEYVNIRISDTGQGMAPETLQRAFEPFFSTKERGKGTGLGLAMVHGFVKQSGGNVKLYSEHGHGTTVSIYLPLASDAAQGAAPAVASDHRAPADAVALVVDDEADLLEIAATYLEEMGYQTLRAANAREALAISEPERRIDLVVTDVIMPGGINGVELAKKLRETHPRVRIVYSSGFPSRALAERSGTRIDAPLLHKPYLRGEIARVLNRVMAETLA